MSSRKRAPKVKAEPVPVLTLPRREQRPWWTAGAVAALLAIYVALAVGGAWHKSPGFDELAHIKQTLL